MAVPLHEAYETYFLGWLLDDDVPHELDRALRDSLGGITEVDLIYPVGEVDEGRVTFLLVVDDDSFLATFEPPDTTTIIFVGRLAGGIYSEKVRGTSGSNEVELSYAHERLGTTPLVIRPLEFATPKAGDHAQWFHQKSAKMAWEMFNLARTRLRQWGMQPDPSPRS